MSLLKFKKLSIETYKPGKSKLSRLKNIVKLSANESALGVSPKVKKEINKKINISKYPDSKSRSLRKYISNKFKCRFENIICGAGSDEIIQMVCTLFLKSKDEVIVVGHKNFNLGLLDNRNQHYVYVDKLIDKIKEQDKNLTLSKNLIYLNNILDSKSDNYQFINLKKIYCNDKSCQIFNNEFELLTYDGGHLTKNGTVFFAEKLKHIGLLFYK